MAINQAPGANPPSSDEPLPGSIGALLQADAQHAATPAAPAAPAASAPASTEDVAPTGKTAEQVDAEWRQRFAGRDRAHNEAERVLREEIETLRKPASRPAGQPGNAAAADDERLTELQNELEAEKRGRVIDQRKAKYPALVAQGAQDSIFASSDEATLAKLNALADDTASGGFIAPTAPRRTAPNAPRPLHERSKAELLDDLRLASNNLTASRNG